MVIGVAVERYVSWLARCGIILASLLAGAEARAGCTDLMPDTRAGDGPKRQIMVEDLIQLRDIGFPDAAVTGPSPLAVSPDGTRIAFVLSRADVATNSYCRALVIVPVEGGAPRVVDRGGEFISLGSFVRGLWVDTGFPALVTPAWSPDGRSIAFIKREHGISQAVMVHFDRSGPPISTQLTVDVEDLWWDRQGKLYVATRPGVEDAAAAIDKEGESGWLYDSRIAPNYGPRPRVRASDAPMTVWEVDPAIGSTRPRRAGLSALPDRSTTTAVSSAGNRAWLERSGTSPFAPQQIWATDANGKKVACGSERCGGRFLGIWWDDGGREVRFLRREGWNQETYALYRWQVGARGPTRSFATTDVIQNCVPARAKLVCTFENSTTPRRIVLVDAERGRWRTVFDPNPEFRRLRLGAVRRLRFRNDRGFEAWGDLVLPPTYRKGTRLPMILVQYNSRGFLRGGTGNEYPILPLAAQGFAVFSFERPRAVASADPTLRTDEELNAANEKGWAERRSVLSAMLAGTDAAIATGSVDPERVGITGLSDGATAVRFALINSDRFAAAAISSCCLEPKTVMTYGGIAWAEFNRAVGYPTATVDAPAFWRPMSLALNAGKIDTPLLMQLSDDEHLLALEAFTALREQGKPVELYVFPDEHHVKWQPVHRLAIYNRNLDWFNFWLSGVRDSDPRKIPQYERWSTLRVGRALSSTAVAPR